MKFTPSKVKNMMKSCLGLLILLFGFSVQAADSGHAHKSKPESKYAGQEAQEIKSLSPDDLVELRRGGGWGLAKAAELNGMPGPAHLLELKDEIPLDPDQVTLITELFQTMKAQAIVQGEKMIGLERQLEELFKRGTITDAELRSSLAAIAETRRELRYIHLATHLKTPTILSADQIKTYNALRGYSAAAPCANVPKGHDAEMWRRHNGCT